MWHGVMENMLLPVVVQTTCVEIDIFIINPF